AGRRRWLTICSRLPGGGGHHAQSWLNGVSDAALARPFSMTHRPGGAPGARVGGRARGRTGPGKGSDARVGGNIATYGPARAGGPAEADPVVHCPATTGWVRSS